MNVLAHNALSALQRYRSIFESRWGGSDALTALKRSALDEFLAVGFPTQRSEAWKYTNLRRLEMRQFALPEQGGVIDADRSQWISQTGPRLVFVNGALMPSLSTTGPQQPGVTLLTFAQWAKNSPDEVAALLAAQRPASASPFELMNTAFFEDGVVLEVSAGASLEDPVYVLHQSTAQAQHRMIHPRLFIRAGANSRVTLIEHYVGAGDTEYLMNPNVSIEIGDGASVTHCRVQEESRRSFHIGTTRARLARDSSYASHEVALGASIGRSSIEALLEGSGATATLRGLFAPSGTQHHDIHTRIEHVAAHTASHEEYRGVADGKGRGVFNGKVVVHPGAQKTDARQSNRNLLLSATAEIDTKPELEIYANDVKCSHGATTGQLDPVSLFYLRSRGLAENDARTLLIRAFAESILMGIPCKPVRDHLEARIDERFEPGAST